MAAVAAAMEMADDDSIGGGGNMVSWVASGVVLWSTAFVLVRSLFPHRSYDFCNRAVSTAHAVTAVCLAWHSVDDWARPLGAGAASTPRQMRALAVSLSYMVYDAACSSQLLLHGGGGRLDVAAHHLVSIVGIGAGLAYRRCGTEMVASLLLTEVSSPLLHLREMLKELGVTGTGLNLLVDVLFAVTFSAARMGVGPYLTYVTVTADNPLLIKAMATGLQLVSAYWFLRILRMVRYKLGKKKPLPPPQGKDN